MMLTVIGFRSIQSVLQCLDLLKMGIVVVLPTLTIVSFSR